MARIKPWDSKEWLYKLYIVEGKTITEMAVESEKLGVPVTSMTIYNALKKFNLVKNERTLRQRSYKSNSNKGYYGK
jgi:hypothetical protein